MSVLRRDPATGAWVIIAPGRALRPRELHTGGPAQQASCPFCAPSDAPSDDELLRIPAPEGSGWLVRVVSNKSPALSPGAPATQRLEGPLFRELGGVGHHVRRAVPADRRRREDQDEEERAR